MVWMTTVLPLPTVCTPDTVQMRLKPVPATVAVPLFVPTIWHTSDSLAPKAEFTALVVTGLLQVPSLRM